MLELLPGEASQPAEGQGEDALPGLRLSPTRLPLPLSLLLAAASGAALFLAFPPVGIWPMAFVAPVPLLWLVRGSRPGRAALCGYAFGLAYLGALLYWILLFGELAWVMLTLMSAGSIALFGALVPAIWRPERAVWSTLGVAALWTVLEWWRGAVPIVGFTWGQLAPTQVDAPSLPLASIAGSAGLSFLVMLGAGLVLLGLERWGSGARARALVVFGTALAVSVAPAAIPTLHPDGRRVDVAAIQVDVASVEHLVGSEEDIAVARLNIERHLGLSGDPPDLAVWGEGALDPGALEDPGTRASVAEAIASVGAPTVAGAVTRDADGAERTVTLAFDGSGALVDEYVKVHLVPFGEFVPFRDALDWISAIEQVPVDRVPGEEITLVSLAGLPEMGTPICFENSFPGINREMVRLGAGFLVLTINNASYEDTAASEQHLQMSRLRAVENGRWVVHAAVSGISAFIDPNGNIVERRGLFEPATMRRSIVSSTRTTPYTRFGDWFLWGSLALTLGLLALPRGRRRQLDDAGPLPSEPRTLVILPTYDERGTIGAVLDGLLALDANLEILVVDDASPDGTGDVVRARAEVEPRIDLVERPAKSGLATAYGVGFDRARAGGYDLVVEMDSDLSHLPEQLPRLLHAAAEHELDLVIGSRYVPGGSVTDWSRARVALSRAGNRYARFCLGFPIKDATSGFRCYRRRALDAILATPLTSDGYGFQVELLHRAWRLGYAVGEVPINFSDRRYGRSKISRRIVAEALWLVTLWGLRARFRGSTAGG